MGDRSVYVKRYTGQEKGLSEIDRREVWRYAGYPGGPPASDPVLNAELESVLDECGSIFRYAVCWLRIPLSAQSGSSELPFDPNAAFLDGCGEAVLMAATVGLEPDRRIARYEKTHPVRALLLQAFATERVEALCDMFCGEFGKDESVTRRCSPGYGDFPLERQREMVRILDTSRQIGVTLNESLLMSPSKSVTAVFGIRAKDEKQEQRSPECSGCSSCNLKDCPYREN